MNVSAFFKNRIVSAIMVAAAGFAGGAVFFPAIAETGGPASLRHLVIGAMAGAAIYLLAWLGLSLALAKRTGKASSEIRQRTSMVFTVSIAPLVSYFPYLLYRSSLEGEIAELPPLGTRWSAVLLLAWSLILMAVLLRMALGSDRSRLVEKLTRKPAATLAVMISAWIIVFFSLDVLKDHYMHVTTVNSALFRESMMHVFDERGFMFSSLLFANGASIFGVHINAIFLLILPIFRIWPDYKLLLLISDIALALSAWPAFLIARRRLSPALSLLIAAMVLLHPIMTAQPGRSDFSELRFVPVFFLAACYFFEKKQPFKFAAAAFLLLTIREDMGLFVAFFGIYAILRRYPIKWILVPLAAGLGWFVVMGSMLLPRLAPSGTAARAALRYGNLGSSGGEIARTLLFRPWKAVQAAFSTPSHIGVAYGLFISYGLGIPLLSGAVLLAVPAVSELMFQNTTNLVNFTALPTVPVLMFAYINGLARFDRIIQRRWYFNTGRATAVTAVFLFFLGLSTFHAWFNPDLYGPRYNYDAAREALALAPGDASIMMPEFMLVYSKPEQVVRGFHQIAYEVDLSNTYHVSEDYIILDRRIPSRNADDRYYVGLQEVTDFVKQSPDYRKIYGRDDIELYVRSGTEPAV